VEVLSLVSRQDVADFARLLPQLSNKTVPDAAQLEVQLRAATDARNNDTRVVVVRGGDGRIQASATGTICRIPSGEKAWIDDVVTDQAHRGRGYARAMMADLHEWMAQRGASAVNLTSKPQRAAAGNLYEADGYYARETRVYRRSLGQTAVERTIS
jgi:GNAT superfamily N-acetyltransferase